ncbi:hypothetical protein [Cellulomonas sp. C5510]|uniref:hypothetical protein n=1 Tax=Cellulomonas sp. C5510 TaxID=2871170 RepID=UPI002106943F|nr:hypothetical protein [Cellulomonas sp. C5510]
MGPADGAQRTLARRVAVLPDGFGVDAAVVLAAGGPHESRVLDDLDALVAQSLLRVEEDARTGAVRYRMLETVREFGRREVLEVGEEARVRDLVLDWAKDLAARIVRDAGSPERLLLDPVGEAEHDNLVAVLRRELAVGTERPDAVLPLYAVVALRWMAQGAHAEVKDVSAGALAASARWRPEAQSEAAVIGLALLAGTELLFGDARAGVTARVRLRRAAVGADLRPPARLLVDLVERFHDGAAVAGVLARARASDDLGARRLALLVSWTVAENEGDLEASVAYSREGYDLAVDTDDPWTRAMGAVTLAGGYAQLLRPQEALDWVAAARTALADPRIAHRDPLLTALSDGLEQSFAMTLLVLGEWDEAERVFELVARSVVDVRDAELVSGLGIAEAWRGRRDVDRALARFRAVLGHVGGLRPGDPWLLVATGICLAAHVLEGRAGHPALAGVAQRVAGLEIAPAGFTDRPVLGTALLGVATWRVATDPGDPTGLELLAVAARMGPRQDFPAARTDLHRERAVAVYGERAVAAAWERAAAMPHGADAVRAVELLRAGGGAGPGGGPGPGSAVDADVR